ncbi:MAG: PKD domain-containing protein [Deltaproteobacteria bacterium]|nr:PKD domain-containing protein [Deltaproteobacteria bacterium]
MKNKQSVVVVFLALIVMMTGLIGPANGDISFQRRPEANFVIKPQSGYAPLFVQIIDTSKFANEIQWIVYDAVDPSEQPWWDDSSHNMFYYYAFPGTYPVVLEATNGLGTDVCVKYVTVLDPGISLSAEFVAAPRSGAVGTEVIFINTTPGEFDKYLWDFGDNSSSTEEDPEHVYTSAGVYTVGLTLMDSNGSVYTQTKVNYINIYPTPTPSMISAEFIADPSTGTPPQTIRFSRLAGGIADSVLWDFGDGTVSEDLNPIHIYQDPGLYTVKLTVNGEEVSKKDYVNIFPSVGEQGFPLALLLQNDEEKLSLVRTFRDQVLNQTLLGHSMIDIYYDHALELVSIFIGDDQLAQDAAGLLTEILPGIQALVEGGSMTVSPAQIESFNALLGRIAARANPELGEVIALLINELTNGQFLANIGITVSAK